MLTLPGNGSLLNEPANNSLTTSGLRSWCTVDSDGDVYGGATIFSGAITYLRPSDLTIPLPEKPAPNTVITLPYGAGTITLNYQNDNAGAAHLRGDQGGAGRPDRRPRRVPVLLLRGLTGQAGHRGPNSTANKGEFR